MGAGWGCHGSVEVRYRTGAWSGATTWPTEAGDDRATRRADKLRKRLGWEPGILNGNGLKPKGMHWRTFERLQGQHDAHVNLALAGMAAKFGLLGERLGGIGAG